jgi:hypothetical protein
MARCALVVILMAAPIALADSGTASLQLVGKRPALLWLKAEKTLLDNVMDPARNNQDLAAEVVSDGRLSVAVRTNYDYWLIIKSESGETHVFGKNTGLSWEQLPEAMLPSTAEGELIGITLQWQPDDAFADRP